MVINTNTSAQTSARLLGQSASLLAKSLVRLSSGSRLVSAEDDVAGQAVSMRFDAQINRTSATINNLGNALSFSQTQDGFLKKIGGALDRMSELSILAQDVTKSNSDRSLYNQEFQTLTTYINDVVSKDFNGVSLFSTNSLNVTTDSEGSTLALAGVSGTYLTNPTTPSAPVGYPSTTRLGDISSVFNADLDGDDVVVYGGLLQSNQITRDNTLSDLANFLNSTSGQTSASYNASTGQFSFTVAAGREIHDWGHMFQNLGFTPSELRPGHDVFAGSGTFSATLTFTPPPTPTPGALDISTANGASTALTSIKSAINQLASDRASVGAHIARMDLHKEQLGTLKDNLVGANSRIKDVDVAQESTEFARYNILMQAGTAMLAQANSTPNSIMRLLS